MPQPGSLESRKSSGPWASTAKCSNLHSEANDLRQKPIAQGKTQNRKIGRNDLCLYDSGKK